MAGQFVGLYPNPPDNMAGFYPTIGGVPIGNKIIHNYSARHNPICDNGLYPIVQSIARILPHIGTRIAIVPYRLFENSVSRGTGKRSDNYPRTGSHPIAGISYGNQSAQPVQRIRDYPSSAYRRAAYPNKIGLPYYGYQRTYHRRQQFSSPL